MKPHSLDEITRQQSESSAGVETLGFRRLFFLQWITGLMVALLIGNVAIVCPPQTQGTIA